MIRKLTNFFLIGEKELPQVIYFFGLFFLIGFGMTLGRSTADALFFKRYGIEYIPLMYIIVSITLCLSSLLYASLADRIPAEKFFKYLFFILGSLLFINWISITQLHISLSYPAYYIIYEIASELLIVHAAHYISQNFDTLQIKRLSPVIMSGSLIGTIFGGIFLASLSFFIGVDNIILIWCLVLLSCLGIVSIRHKRHGPSPYYTSISVSGNQVQQSLEQVKEGLLLINKSPLLKSMSFALFFMVITFYIMCYSANRIYTETFTDEKQLAAFFGILSTVNSLAALFIQLFITNRLIRKYGAKKINLVFPITSIFSYFTLLISFTLPSALVASFNKDAIMPSLRNPVRNIFFNALPDNIQGRARATSIIAVLPIALSLTGVLLLFMQSLDNTAYLPLMGIASGLTYLYFSKSTNNAYVSEMVHHLKKKLFIPETDKRINTQSHDKELLKELIENIKTNSLTVDIAQYLTAYFPYQATDIILKHIDTTTPAARDQIIKLLSKNYSKPLQDYLLTEIHTRDQHLKHTILKILFENRVDDAFACIDKCLNSDNPREQSIGIYGTMLYHNGTIDSREKAIWLELIKSDNPNQNLSALELVHCLSHENRDHKDLIAQYENTITRLLDSSSQRIITLTLQALQKWPHTRFVSISEKVYNIYSHSAPTVRLECIKLIQLLSNETGERLINEAIEDNSPSVRGLAVDILLTAGSQSISDLIQWITTENKGSPRAQHSILKTIQQQQPSDNLMQDIALAKAKDALLLTRAINILKNDNKLGSIASLELLNYTLIEKRNEVIDLALHAMTGLEDPTDINVIRAGIKSNNQRLVANALEVLLNMKQREVADILIEIYEEINQKSDKSSTTTQAFSTTKELLEWCSNRLDPWLRACSLNAKQFYTGS